MKRYKHYSFDLWLTLLKSNPEFKLERAKYFQSHFNRNNFSVAEVQSIIKNLDDLTNSANELVGNNISSLSMYAMILKQLGYPTADLKQADIISVYHICNTLFLKYPPTLFDSDTLPTLKELKKTSTLSILSNTGFIESHTLKSFFRTMDSFDNLFVFKMFSDEYGISKPNPDFFSQMIKRVESTTTITYLELKQNVLHVGDNHKADLKGAKAAGLDALIINNGEKTIKDLLL